MYVYIQSKEPAQQAKVYPKYQQVHLNRTPPIPLPLHPLPHSNLDHLVDNTVAIAIRRAALEARIILDTAPAAVRALLVPVATAVVVRAETSAGAGVQVAAAVGHEADLPAGALAAAGAAAGLLLDGGGGGAAVLMRRVSLGCWKRRGKISGLEMRRKA